LVAIGDGAECAGDDVVDVVHLSVLSNIGLFDQKASLLLAFDSAMLLFCFQSHMITSGPPPWPLHNWLAWLPLVAIVGFFLSSAFALVAVFPRMSGSRQDYLFWGSRMMKMPLTQYIAHVRAQSATAAAEAKWCHVHILARICRAKGRWLRGGLLTGAFAFFLLICMEATKIG
jgi:hypothetical protein